MADEMVKIGWAAGDKQQTPSDAAEKNEGPLLEQTSGLTQSAKRNAREGKGAAATMQKGQH